MDWDDDGIGLGAFIGLGALLLGAAGLSYKAAKAEIEERSRRRSIPIEWGEGLSQRVFEDICRKVEKTIKRLKIVSISGLYIECEVRSTSGLSTWNFCADFYDYGNLTGSWYIYGNENEDSTVPSVFLNRVTEEIREIINSYKIYAPISAEDAIGLDSEYVYDLFDEAGFTNIKEIPINKSFSEMFKRKGTIPSIMIGGVSDFSTKYKFSKNELVEIIYYK